LQLLKYPRIFATRFNSFFVLKSEINIGALFTDKKKLPYQTELMSIIVVLLPHCEVI
jgi:hypothetical protein